MTFLDGCRARLEGLWQELISRDGWLVTGERQLVERPPKSWVEQLHSMHFWKSGGEEQRDRLREFLGVGKDF